MRRDTYGDCEETIGVTFNPVDVRDSMHLEEDDLGPDPEVCGRWLAKHGDSIVAGMCAGGYEVIERLLEEDPIG